MDGLQLPFHFEVTPTYLEEDFLKSSTNALAYEAIQAWPNWTSYGSVLFGPPKTGKTHLAHIFQKKSKGLFLEKDNLKDLDAFEPSILSGKGYILENVDSWAASFEPSLFHLCNLVKERKAFLLLTAETPPPLWKIQLADLHSRLSLFPAFRLSSAEEELLEAILIKKTSEMQVDLDAAVQRYILTHLDRSADSLIKLLEEVNHASLRLQRKITIPLVKEVLTSRMFEGRINP
jgi:chromosomal replication initiation ATPase DnaA